MSVVSSKETGDWDRSDMSFGKESLGHVVMLLRFPAPFSDTTQIVSAYLVLEPALGSIPGPSPVTLSLARILEPWVSEQVAWSRLPRFSQIESTFLASTWANRILRMDVTTQVRRWREHRSDDHGLAVFAAPQNHSGETYSLGLAGGEAPILDVYLR
jgi:hypothetical protein